jgi:hypothetical protein
MKRNEKFYNNTSKNRLLSLAPPRSTLIFGLISWSKPLSTNPNLSIGSDDAV